ncbi:MAG: hypothetical protein KDC54_23355, partial [Lewinella sp.]|nr:hypothetical protein [Lewinella sp.]
MKNMLFLLLFLFPVLVKAQFTPTPEETDNLTILVTDGTYAARNSPLRPPGPNDFQDIIRPLGMTDAIQAGAFLERPIYGKAGFLLIFCVDDAIGGKQGTYEVNGQTFYGVYRLIRQKIEI